MYNIDIAAAAIGIPKRDLDNFLRRQFGDLVPKGSQGRSRTIPHAVVEQAAVAMILVRDLGCNPAKAVTLAAALIENGDTALKIGTLSTLRFDLRRIRAVLDQTLADAVETTPPSRRGRPCGSDKPKKLRGASGEALAGDCGSVALTRRRLSS
jgi:hypothetical protein